MTSTWINRHRYESLETTFELIMSERVQEHILLKKRLGATLHIFNTN